MRRFIPPITSVILCLMSNSTSWAADNELTADEKAAGWQLLFNGKHHTGWKCNNGKTIATPVEDGCLVPFKSGGYLIVYEKPFSDFVLACDVKMGEGDCNSGIFFRVGDLKNPIYTGLEMQVLDGTGTSIHDFGSLYDLVPPSANRAKPAPEWNHVEITCQGAHVQVEVNGEVIAKMNCDDFPKPGLRPDGTKHKFGVAIKDMPRAGYLGFQDHGHPCWYKNVKLRELRN